MHLKLDKLYCLFILVCNIGIAVTARDQLFTKGDGESPQSGNQSRLCTSAEIRDVRWHSNAGLSFQKEHKCFQNMEQKVVRHPLQPIGLPQKR